MMPCGIQIYTHVDDINVIAIQQLRNYDNAIVIQKATNHEILMIKSENVRIR